MRIHFFSFFAMTISILAFIRCLHSLGSGLPAHQMSKRKDDDAPSAHSPIATKRRRPAPVFRVARNRDSEPQDTTSSSLLMTTCGPILAGEHFNAKPEILANAPPHFPGFRAARMREPRGADPSGPSKSMNEGRDSITERQPSMKQQRLHPGFRVARSREHENTTPGTSSLPTNSRITTLALSVNGCLEGGHRDWGHNPSVTNQTSIATTSADDATPPDYEVDSMPSSHFCGNPTTPPTETRHKRKRTSNAQVCRCCTCFNLKLTTSILKSKLLEWLSFRDAMLDEILCHNGLGDFLGHQFCIECNEEMGIFKCKDCSSGCHLRCQACIVKAHRETPLHRIEVSQLSYNEKSQDLDSHYPQKWTGEFFDKTCLMDLGLRVQLGHGGGVCPCPSPGSPNFSVFDTSGIHIVNIDYCNCPNDNVPDRKTQLLRQGWFPATFSWPKTVFTFDCLNTFHEHTLQGKGNLYDFYHLLIRKTDNANLSNTFVSLYSLHLSLYYSKLKPSPASI